MHFPQNKFPYENFNLNGWLVGEFVMKDKKKDGKDGHKKKK